MGSVTGSALKPDLLLCISSLPVNTAHPSRMKKKPVLAVDILAIPAEG